MADSLSRRMGQEAILALISFPSTDWIKELKSSYNDSDEVQEILNKLLQGDEGPKDYSLQHGMLLQKRQNDDSSKK